MAHVDDLTSFLTFDSNSSKRLLCMPNFFAVS